MKLLTRLFSRVLLFSVLCLLLLDAALWHLDPSGIVRYIADYQTLQTNALPSPDGLRYAPGNYNFRQYSATIGLDGFRAVADSRVSECRIAFVGDSITFGMGSDISFVDLLADDLPAQTINAGITGYSAPNVAAELTMIPADGYVWLIVFNDDAEFLKWSLPSGYVPPATQLYYNFYLEPRQPEVNEPGRFIEHAPGILKRDDVIAFAFEGMHLSDIVEREFPDVTMIPYYSSTVSRYDQHPDSAGAEQIADAMREPVLEFTRQQCA